MAHWVKVAAPDRLVTLPMPFVTPTFALLAALRVKRVAPMRNVGTRPCVVEAAFAKSVGPQGSSVVPTIRVVMGGVVSVTLASATATLAARGSVLALTDFAMAAARPVTLVVPGDSVKKPAPFATVAATGFAWCAAMPERLAAMGASAMTGLAALRTTCVRLAAARVKSAAILGAVTPDWSALDEGLAPARAVAPSAISAVRVSNALTALPAMGEPVLRVAVRENSAAMETVVLTPGRYAEGQTSAYPVAVLGSHVAMAMPVVMVGAVLTVFALPMATVVAEVQAHAAQALVRIAVMQAKTVVQGASARLQARSAKDQTSVRVSLVGDRDKRAALETPVMAAHVAIPTPKPALRMGTPVPQRG